jgi:Spy/CpxP family protein refolding chaperone
MRMRTAGSLLILLVTLAGSAAAQQPGDVQTGRAQIQAERTKLVADNLPLTEAEGAQFWPLYNRYRDEMRLVNDRTVALIDSYAKHYETLTDQDAEVYLKEMQDVQKAQLDLKRSYVGKFRKILPPKKVARYFQIENKMDAIVAYELSQAVPLLQ